MTAVHFFFAVVMPGLLMSQDSKACWYTWRGILNSTDIVYDANVD